MDDISDLSELNGKAWHAALGMSERWDQDLIDLLRSDEPIHRWVRDALADAIEGKNALGVRITMSGNKAIRDGTAAVETRKRWVQIGEWIGREIGKGRTRVAAIEAAASYFCKGEKACDKAYDYYRRYRRWRDALDIASDPLFSRMSEAGIENMFHVQVHYGTPPDEGDWGKQRSDIMKEFFE
ncbi:MAG: hypothetical protein RL268_271 [Pseudomonadota bacterium]|jgi:hypothetical protein